MVKHRKRKRKKHVKRDLRNTYWIAFMGFVAISVVFFQRDKLDERVFSADGYTKAIEQHIAKVLQYNRDTLSGLNVVTLTEEASSNDIIWEFYQKSYLRKDIAANDPKLWVIGLKSKEVFGIDPNAHNIPLPLNAPSYWEGELNVRSEYNREHILQGSQINTQTIVLRPLAEKQKQAPELVVVKPFNSNWEGRKTGEAVTIKGPNGGDAVILFTIGDSVVMQKMKSASSLIKVNGEVMETAEFRELPVGAELLIENVNGRNPVKFTNYGLTGTNKQSLTSYQSLIGRRYNNQMRKFTQRFVGSMNLIIRNYERSDDPDDTKKKELLAVKTMVTLDPNLQEKIQDYIEKRIVDQNGQTETTVPVAVTVMNALNGEILTLASLPNAEAINAAGSSSRRSLRDNQNFINYPIGSVAKPLIGAAIIETWPSLKDLKVRWCLHGDNLDKEDCHSVDKENRPNARVINLAGYGFAAGIKPGGSYRSAPWVDYAEFIKYSSNSYAALLMTLALTENPESQVVTKEDNEIPTDYIIEPSVPSDVPSKMRPPKKRFAPTGKIIEKISSTSNWPKEHENLYDVYSEFIPIEGRRYSKYIWNSAFEAINDIDPEILKNQGNAFRGLMPEAVNLQINTASNVREDIISLILGGGQSRWNTIKVAESYARLVTGSQVTAKIVLSNADISDDGRNISPRVPKTTSTNCGALKGDELKKGRTDDGLFCDSTRAVSLKGLYGVANELGGTAYIYRDRITKKTYPTELRIAIQNASNKLDDKYYLCVFSKTGTPEIAKIERRNIDALVTELGSSTRRYLVSVVGDGLNSDQIRFVNIQHKNGVVRHNDPNFIDSVVQAVRNDQALSRRFTVTNIEVKTFAEHIEKFNKAKGSRRRRYLTIDPEGLVKGRSAVFSSDKETFGKSLAYVAATYPKNGSTKRQGDFCKNMAYSVEPIAAYSVAINIPHPLKSGSQAAKEIGGEVLDLLFEKYLEPKDE